MRTYAAKESLRKQFLEIRREMNFEDVWSKSAIIQQRLIESPLFKKIRKIALYSSIQNEVLTEKIFAVARLEKMAIYYPRVFRGAVEMKFLPVSSLDELSPGAFDIREPSMAEGCTRAIDPPQLDLIVIPGVAFDLKGARLGFGKGFYDRMQTSQDCRLVALAYDFQLQDFIPTESFDLGMNTIITEKRLINT